MSQDKAIAKQEKRPDAPVEWRPREEIGALADRLQATLPGDLSREAALALAQYSAALDANPFRGEIYAYEQHGKLTLVESYRLLVRWARRECNFAERYERMSRDELAEDAIGFRCYVLREDANDTLQMLVEAGAPWDEAFKTAAQCAVGVVTLADRTTRKGRRQSPPTGWTWEEVARKRALKNALNRAYGAPSPREIAAETWRVDDDIDPGPHADAVPADRPRRRARLFKTEGTEEKIDAVTGELVEPEPDPETRPAGEPETVRRWLRKRAKWTQGEADDWSDAKRQADDEAEPPHERAVQRLAALMGKALEVEGDADLDVDRKRYSVLAYVFKRESTKKLTAAEVDAAISWLERQEGSWEPNAVAAEECRQLLRAALQEAGQQELPLDSGDPEDDASE